MARTDDPEGVEPHPGDPWHPTWEPDESDETEEAAEFGRDSSVDDVYAALRDLDEAGTLEEDELEPPEPVLADVEPMQISDSPESPTSVAVDWETHNVEEERRLEAVASVFAGEDLRSIESDLETALEGEESAAEADRRAEQVETAEGDWMHDEIRTLEGDLLAGEFEGIAVAEEAEATRRDDQIEMAWSGEAAETSRTVEASYTEFEEYREGFETETEDTRRVAESDVAERTWVQDEMQAVEGEMAADIDAAEGAAADAEEARRDDQVEVAHSEEAAESIEEAAAALADEETAAAVAEAAVEAERRVAESEHAEEERVDATMRGLEVDEEGIAAVVAEDDEAEHVTGQLESARSDEAAEASEEVEATYSEFEEFREGAEFDAEHQRRASGVEEAEHDDFADRIGALEAELTDQQEAVGADGLTVETARSHQEVELAASGEASAEIEGYIEDLQSDALIDEAGAASDEAVRSGEQIYDAGADEFAESMEATHLDLADSAAADEDAVAAAEQLRLSEQLEDAVVVEDRLMEEAAAERYRNDESQMRFTEDIDERIALDAELARVDEQIAHAFAFPEPSSVVTVAALGPEQPDPPMPESRVGWFQRLFGRGRRPEAAATEVAAASADDGTEDAVPGDDEQREPRIVPADIGVRRPHMEEGSFDDAVESLEPLSEDPGDDQPEADWDDELPATGDELPATGDDRLIEQEPLPALGDDLPASGDDLPKPIPDEATDPPIPDGPVPGVSPAAAIDDAVVWEDPLAAAGYGAEESEQGPAAETADTTASSLAEHLVVFEEQEDEVAVPAEQPEPGDEVEPGDDEDGVGDEDDDVPDFATFTSDQYVQATTEDYAGLAEAVAKAAAEDTGERAAVAASIPGLESGVVGLEDVVEAETGERPTLGVSRRSDLALRVGTGLVLLGLFAGSLFYEVTTGLFVLVVLLIAESEFYTVLIRNGYRPVALFGFLGTVGAFVGTWLWGVGAVPISVALTLVAAGLLMGVAPQKTSSLQNLALTVAVMAWVGGLGAFAFALIASANYRWLFAAVVVTTAAMDVIQYFVGKRIGRHPMAPNVSPNKTIEGLVSGVAAAIVVGIVFGFFGPFNMANGLALGAVVGGVSPFGDLAVSVVKRALAVKDMGGVLPGHGGVLDRVDAMIIVLPAAWIVFRAAGLL